MSATWRSQQGVPGVLIEMKKRGENLSKHYAQVERYCIRITPNPKHPHYAMLCNLDGSFGFLTLKTRSMIL